MAILELRGDFVTLRELREDFFTDYLEAFSAQVRKLLHVSDISSELDYLKSRLAKQKIGTTMFFCVFDTQSDKLIGALEIRNQSETSNQLYSWLHEDYWGTGRYQEVLRLACQEYFKRINRPFLLAHVDVANKSSYFGLKKYGFADLGLKRGPHGKQYQLVLRNVRFTF